MPPSPPYLLDTNVLVHLTRRSPVSVRIQSAYRLLAAEPTPLICIVSVGEVRSLAHQRGWSPARLNHMEYLLGYFRTVPLVLPDIVEGYAVIDSYFQRRGRRFGKNDLWIAAAAHLTRARLLTTDRDFDAMNPLFLSRDWIDPTP